MLNRFEFEWQEEKRDIVWTPLQGELTMLFA